jgi:hypothetical protein
LELILEAYHHVDNILRGVGFVITFGGGANELSVFAESKTTLD